MPENQTGKSKKRGALPAIGIMLAVALGIYMLPMLYGPLMLLPLLFSGDAPPAPEIREAEFPFVLTYDLNGETKVLEDAIVCQFDGYYSRGEGGKARRWKTSLKNNNELMPYQDGRILLLNLRENQVLDSAGRRVIEVYFYAGAAGTYMGDSSRFTADLGKPQELDYVGYVYKNEDGTVSDGSMSVEDAYLTFKLRIISWEGSLPIVNTFST